MCIRDNYSAYDGVNVFGAYATSKDLKTFERKGIITPKFTFDEYASLIRKNLEKISEKHVLFYDLFQKYHLSGMMKAVLYVWDKNVVFFPRKINGKFAFYTGYFPPFRLY